MAPSSPSTKNPHTTTTSYTNKRCTESGTDGQQGEVRLNASRPPKPCVAQVRLSVQPRGGESGGIPQFSTQCTAAPHDASVVGPTRVWEFFCHPTTSDAWCRQTRTRTHILNRREEWSTTRESRVREDPQPPYLLTPHLPHIHTTTTLAGCDYHYSTTATPGPLAFPPTWQAPHCSDSRVASSPTPSHHPRQQHQREKSEKERERDESFERE